MRSHEDLSKLVEIEIPLFSLEDQKTELGSYYLERYEQPLIHVLIHHKARQTGSEKRSR